MSYSQFVRLVRVNPNAKPARRYSIHASNGNCYAATIPDLFDKFCETLSGGNAVIVMPPTKANGEST